MSGLEEYNSLDGQRENTLNDLVMQYNDRFPFIYCAHRMIHLKHE